MIPTLVHLHLFKITTRKKTLSGTYGYKNVKFEALCKLKGRTSLSVHLKKTNKNFLDKSSTGPNQLLLKWTTIMQKLFADKINK